MAGDDAVRRARHFRDVLAWPPPAPGTTVAEHWDGTSWALQAAPPPPGAYGAALYGISCPAPAYCTAAGSYVMPGSHIGQPLAEHES